MIATLLAELRATTALEAVATLLGLLYVTLIVQRRRAGWIAGALSSAIYVYLSYGARLPMQALLQAWYVAMGVYGWYSWTRNAAQHGGRIRRWPPAWHLVALAGIVALSALSARVLAAETQAAWPWIDSLTTWTSVFATWLVTRMQLENWLYWIANDLLTVFLFAAQSHPLTALLYLVYLGFSVAGFLAWRRQYRSQQG
ncbi:MAG: nicotinamide mononucleotide transporter [Gammaproteobacteria bacterium]|nr:nicotinamide mononucleotide transporter [Gammaproteobacteria bacterium]